MRGLASYATVALVVLGLLLPAVAVFGQDKPPDKPRATQEELERRVDELEAIVRQLLAEKAAREAAAPPAVAPPAEPAVLPAPVENGEAEPAPPPAVTPQVIRSMITEQLEAEAARLRKLDEERKQAVADAAAAGYEVGSDTAFRALWNDGLVVETANRDFRVHLGGRLQADAAWFAPDENLARAFPDNWRDGADFRRIRYRADGSLYEVFDFVLEMEFSQGINGQTQHPRPTDVFVDFKYLPFFGNIAVGHYKEPFSLQDYATPDSYGVFMERAVDDAFTPDRNMGIMWHNAYFDDTLALAAGVFRTNSDPRSGNAFDYGDGEYAYDIRLAFIPYYENEGRNWLMFGPAYSHRGLDPTDDGLGPNNANPSRVRFSLRAPVRVNSPVLIDTGDLLADNADLYNVQAALNLGPLLLQAEYYNAQVNNLRRGLVAAGVPRLVNTAFHGWYAQASYFVTGEYHPLDRKWGRLMRVRPNENWFLVKRGDNGRWSFGHGWGAWELAARYSYCDLDGAALGAFGGVPGVPGSAVGAVATAGTEYDVTFAINCYLNPQMRAEVNYVHAFRDVATLNGTGDADILGMRLWFDF